jgi:hypothetical protein
MICSVLSCKSMKTSYPQCSAEDREIGPQSKVMEQNNSERGGMMPENKEQKKQTRRDGNRNKQVGQNERKRIKTTKVKTGCRTCKVSSTP